MITLPLNLKVDVRTLDSLAAQASAAGHSLGPFDRLDLAQRVGALQLMPENGANVVRLELAASIVSALPAVYDLPQISTSRWRRWLGHPALGSVRRLEDPPSNPFTETVVFYGGSYTVLPGTAERSAPRLQMVLRAIFLGDQSQLTLSNEFRRAAHELALAALTVSNECALKADLGRSEEAHRVPTDEVFQPLGEHLARLRRAVTFPADALTARLSTLGLDVDALAPLTLDIGTTSPSDLNPEQLPVYRRPILRVDGSYVLIAPSSLPAALTHAILSKASECGDLPVVAKRLRDATFESVDHSLHMLGCSRVEEREVTSDPTFPATRALYSIDTDKVLALILLTDPLRQFDAATVGGTWPQENLNERLGEEIRKIEEETALRQNAPNGVLMLVAFASPGRRLFLGLDDYGFARPLLTAAEDLEVIANAEPGHLLLLWQYAKASDQLRNHTEVLGFDPLDEFTVWRSNGFTYYMSDGRQPTVLSCAPGSAVSMRVEARDARDIHGMLAADGLSTVEVIRYHEPDVPIYTPRPGPGTTFSLAVEGLPLALWVKAVRSPEDLRFEELLHGLVDMIAYWVWQFEPHLHETLERLARGLNPLVLEVDVVESEAWFADDVAPGDALAVDPTGRGFKLTFREGTAALVRGGDNAGEREIVRLLLDALHDRGRDAEGIDNALSEDEVVQALDTHAPLGAKKKFFQIPSEPGTVLNGSDLPPYRPLQPAAFEEWRGREPELLSRLNLRPGSIAPRQRVTELNRMVEGWFAAFEQLVATINPEGLLEYLVARGERLIQTEERDRILIPTQIACFGSVPEMVDELKRDRPVLATTAVAHRFVTEYIAAKPPSGFRPLSLEAYDELISLAAILVSRGLDSDAIKFGLADTQLTVLESGRLGVSASEFEAASEDFGKRAYEEQILRSSDAFASIFQSPTDSDPDPLIPLSEFEAATKGEFGISITQISQFLQALAEIGAEQEGPSKVLLEKEARKRVGADLAWSGVELDAALSLLGLGPRADFLEPPVGFARRDVYPWAFNRRLSHLSRPLLLRENDGAREVVWGTRALIRTREYLFQQLVSGRFRGQSDRMRLLQGRMTNRSGELFNNRVAEAYEATESLIVRRRVKSISGQPIESQPGQSLGDIDVLVADPSQRELLLVETKDFATARTPAEFGNEEKKLRKTLKTHGERSAWIRAHLQDVLHWLSLDEAAEGKWKVKQLVVVSGEAFTPGLRDLSVPVLTLSALRDKLATARRVTNSQKRSRHAPRKRRRRGRKRR